MTKKCFLGVIAALFFSLSPAAAMPDAPAVLTAQAAEAEAIPAPEAGEADADPAAGTVSEAIPAQAEEFSDVQEDIPAEAENIPVEAVTEAIPAEPEAEAIPSEAETEATLTEAETEAIPPEAETAALSAEAVTEAIPAEPEAEALSAEAETEAIPTESELISVESEAILPESDTAEPLIRAAAPAEAGATAAITDSGAAAQGSVSKEPVTKTVRISSAASGNAFQYKKVTRKTASDGRTFYAVKSLTPEQIEAQKLRKVDRIHFLTLNDLYAASDSILVQSNGRYGLIDASHPAWDPDPALNRTTANVDDVISYLKRTGVGHLDFVVATHSHSDHIGGMKFLAQAAGAAGRKLIDQKTVFFYKQYYFNAQEEGKWGWQNTRMFNEAVSAMRGRGAIMVETSSHAASALQKAGASFKKGGSDPVSDSIRFKLGDFSLALYNLYHNSSENENLNSIVTAVAKGDRTALLTADVEVNEGLETRMTDAVAADYGTVDLYKAGHHGYEESTSFDTLERLAPSAVVTTTNRRGNYYEDDVPFNEYLRGKNIPVYRTSEQQLSLTADFSGQGIRYVTYGSDGKLSAAPTPWKARMSSGWKKWQRGEDDYDYVYIYDDGTSATGWQQLTRSGVTNWYLFGDGGVTLRGLQRVGSDYYFTNNKGIMQKGWQATGGRWYFFDGYGVMQRGWRQIDGTWYYLSPKTGAMQTGWLLTGGKRYYLDGSGAMQKNGWVFAGGKWAYLGADGAGLTGWQQIGGKWYYFSGTGFMLTGWQTIGGSLYYLGSDGAMVTSRSVMYKGVMKTLDAYGVAH